MKYLGRYLTGGPISDQRIVAADEREVTFLAREGKTPGGDDHQIPNDRQHSDWTARKTEWNGSVTFWLTKAAGKSIEYNSEAEWRTATIEIHADPSEIAASLSGVTGYKADKDFAIGTFADGHWLLDFATHQLKTWKSEDEWKHAVSTGTPLKTTWLRDPKGWVNQSRDPGVLVAYLAVIGVTVFLSLHGYRRSAPQGQAQCPSRLGN